ncbi:MAG TPA: redoxin domain-containing protein [Dehalococcoidia bacterium]|nr:redoxin domain-containing protein [Dehalococcoidia bacterium]
MTQPPQEPTEAPQPVAAPDLTTGEWLQGDPVQIQGSGQPVLIDFWDYTCMNCLRTLPYVEGWHQRYKDLGLRVIGVHTPEFSFARNPEHVRRAIESHGITYPVVLDADFSIWKSYENQYWPAKYFVDQAGLIRARHYGEGGYADSEGFLQTMLREQDGFSADLPAVMDAVRPEDAVGAVCYRVTPELYCGYQRGLIGNVGAVAPDSPMTYTDPGKHVEGTLYLDGDWLLSAESLGRPFGAQTPSRTHLAFMAVDVNLVMHPPITGDAAKVRVLLDGEPIDASMAGDDVVDGVASVDMPRMYSLVKGDDAERHELVLETESDGLAAFAFTFASCVVPAP